jgi:hypothetical protein
LHKKIDTATFDMILSYIKPKHNSAEPAKTRFDQGICRDLLAAVLLGYEISGE